MNKHKSKLTPKEQDLIALGIYPIYRAMHFFAFSFILLISGICLCLTSRFYFADAKGALASFLAFGIFAIAVSLLLALFGLYWLKKKGVKQENAVLLCPLSEKRIIRNGYLVSSVLLLIGYTSFAIGMLFYPAKPIHGTALFCASLVVLFYASLLLIATIRDQMIVSAARIDS
jgi:hypothetical protein